MISAQVKEGFFAVVFLLLPILFIPTHLITYPNILHLSKDEGKDKWLTDVLDKHPFFAKYSKSTVYELRKTITAAYLCYKALIVC